MHGCESSRTYSLLSVEKTNKIVQVDSLNFGKGVGDMNEGDRIFKNPAFDETDNEGVQTFTIDLSLVSWVLAVINSRLPHLSPRFRTQVHFV